ncbi:hypothetical protein IFR04_013923 [Cadophora malorum]|uniref:Uncharacterized protein n=1 Tax=Cadophora malorum TaxID=108018 RepID=A0A8H7T5R9_9HELO|nr:hypothetical protein IFR04_013923 [Cadophora malorum]
MATARLRKKFKYPTDTDSEEDGPEAMDEEEQNHLIQTMQQENATRNAQYSLLLLAISLLSTLPYIRTLFTLHTTLLSILSITSLLSTAYLIHILPPHVTGLQYLDNLNTSSFSAPRSLASKKAALLRAGVGGGPVEKYLPLLNCGLCVVLVGLGGVVGRKLEGSGRGLWWGFEWLPAGVWGVTVLAKWVMGGVDPEGELGSLRYELKGA